MAEKLAKSPQKTLSRLDPPVQYTAPNAMYAQAWYRQSPLSSLADGKTNEGASVALEIPTTSDAGEDYITKGSHEAFLDKIMGQTEHNTAKHDKKFFVGEVCATLDSVITFIANVGLRQCVTVDPEGENISVILECVIDIGDCLSELPVRRYFKKYITTKPHLPMVIVSFFDRAHVAVASVTQIQANVNAVVASHMADVAADVYLAIREDKEELIKTLRSMAAGGHCPRPTLLWENSKGNVARHTPFETHPFPLSPASQSLARCG